MTQLPVNVPGNAVAPGVRGLAKVTTVWLPWAWQKPTPGDKREGCALLESAESGTPAAPVGTAVHGSLAGGAGNCG